jgi:hypothetical protein
MLHVKHIADEKHKASVVYKPEVMSWNRRSQTYRQGEKPC